MVGAYKQTGNGSFRPGTSFRPSEIVRRIIGLQSIFYLSLFVQIFALKLFFGYIFGFVDIPLCSVVYPSSSELGVFRYLLVFVSQDSSSLIVGYMMSYVVERSRLCVDYGVTLALIHAAIIVLIRRSIWILFSIEIMLLLSSVCVCSIVMGRKSCLKKELLPIPVGTSLMNRFSDTNGTLHRSEKPISSSQWPLRIMGSYLRRTYSHFRHILSSNRTDAGVVGGDSQSLLS